MADSPTARLQALGLSLPPPPRPMGSYTPVVVHGGVAYVAGQVATSDGVVLSPGQVDAEVPVARAQELARLATLQALSALQATLGSLDRVIRILRVGVFVASSDGFTRQPEVANGSTELLIAVLGEAGRPARAAVGVRTLPGNAAVEIEVTAAVE